MAQSDLLKRLLEKPVGPKTTGTMPKADLSAKVEVAGDRAEVLVNVPAGAEPGEAAAEQLRKQGEDPANWEIVALRRSEWTMATGELGESVRYSFRRLALGERPNLDEVIESIDGHRFIPFSDYEGGDHGFLVLIGDMQFGKIDGDGVEGTVKRCIDYLDKAAEKLLDYRELFDIGHVHIGWLGDHIEGFVSQGGANTWRTTLTLNEQIRVTRRVMLYALQVFAPLCERLTMAAVPGNHGEPQRFAGKGVTRYDDSHDTESLIAVKDAVDLSERDDFAHVEFYVPDTDELTVVVDVAGTLVGHHHGHEWRSGKHFEWWKGQAFNPESALGQCHLLVFGHEHHELIDSDGKRWAIRAPAMESMSTWWRNKKGTVANPGLIVAVTKDGHTSPVEVVR